MRNILYALGFTALLFLGGFLTGRCTRTCPQPPQPQTDTVYVTDTITIDHPAPQSEIPDGYELVPVGTVDEYSGTVEELMAALAKKPSVVTIHDTAYISVPMSDYTFTDDETYKAVVRGYNVSMLRHESYQKTQFVTAYKVVPPKWEIKPYFRAFYSPIGIATDLGIKAQIGARKWQIEPSVGYGLGYDGTRLTRGPTFTFELDYVLFRK